MGNRFPDIGGGLHFSAVSYVLTLSGITGRAARMGGGPISFTFAFDTGQTQPQPGVDLNDVTWTYANFDEDQADAAVTNALDQIAVVLSSLLIVDVALVKADMNVTRQWAVEPNQTGMAAPLQLVGGGTGSTFLLNEVMPYPPGSPQDTDAAHAADGGENVAQQ